MRWDGGELTYAGLSDAADRLAAELQRRGAGPESVVATCLPRGADLVIAELAILRAGAAYLPLDPENPADRLAYMCADAGVRAGGDEREVGGPGPARAADRSSSKPSTRTSPARRPWRSIPATSPTSSTRRVRPAARRA